MNVCLIVPELSGPVEGFCGHSTVNERELIIKVALLAFFSLGNAIHTVNSPLQTLNFIIK